MPNTTVEVREGVSLNIKDKSAREIADALINFCDSYGPIARYMWKINYWDHSTIKVTRVYTKELEND